MDYHTCPNRTRQFEIKDFYTDEDKCTYCGSISPQKFLILIKSGIKVRIDKVNKVFIIDNSMKFHYNHCDVETQDKIASMYKNGDIKIIGG